MSLLERPSISEASPSTIEVLTGKQLKERLVEEERQELKATAKTTDILDRLAAYMLGGADRFYVYLVNIADDQRKIDKGIRNQLEQLGVYEGEASGAYTATPEAVMRDSDYDVTLYRWSHFVEYEGQEAEAFDVCYEACRGDELPKMWELQFKE